MLPSIMALPSVGYVILFLSTVLHQTSCSPGLITSIQAPSTLIHFQAKTELFCSVFKKICVHTYRFRIVFARPHYNAVSV